MVHLFSSLVLTLLIHFIVYATKISATDSQWVDPQTYSPRLLSNRKSEFASKTSEILKNQQQTNLDYNAPSLSMLAYSQTKLKPVEATNVEFNEPRLSMLAYSQTKLKPAGEKLKTSRLTVPINKQQQLQSRQHIQNHLEQQEQQQQLQQQQQQEFQQQLQQQSYLTQLRQQSLMRQALANNLKDSTSREQIQTLKAKNRNKSLRTLSAPRKFEDFERSEKMQRKQDYLRPTKFQNDFDSALTLSRRQNQQQQQLLQQQQQQMLQNSMNYPFQYNYPQASSINTLAMSLNPNRLQTQSTSSETVLPTQQKSSIVRLSNLQALDLLKRKKPANHVLAALRQSKIDDDTDLISEAGRFSRRNKSFKFQFEKTKNNEKLEIDGNAEASLMNSNNQKQIENKEDQNEDVVIVKEESAPSVVLIKKTSVPTQNTRDEILKSEENVIKNENESSNKEKDAPESYINHLKDDRITESKNAKDSTTSEIQDVQQEILTNEKDALTKIQNSEETNENLKAPEQSIRQSNDDSEPKEIISEISSETVDEIKKTDAIIAPKVAEELTQKNGREQNAGVNNEIEEEEEEISTE